MRVVHFCLFSTARGLNEAAVARTVVAHYILFKFSVHMKVLVSQPDSKLVFKLFMLLFTHSCCFVLCELISAAQRK